MNGSGAAVLSMLLEFTPNSHTDPSTAPIVPVTVWPGIKTACVVASVTDAGVHVRVFVGIVRRDNDAASFVGRPIPAAPLPTPNTVLPVKTPLAVRTPDNV